MGRAHSPLVPSRTFEAISRALGVLVLLRLQPALRVCDNPTPATGQTVTCSGTTPPSPATTPVVPAGGSTNATVNVQAGAELNVTCNVGILVYERSTVTTLGTINGSDLGAYLSGSVTLNETAGGSIVGKGVNGIDANGGGTFSNAGTISASNVTLPISNASTTISDTGTLECAITDGHCLIRFYQHHHLLSARGSVYAAAAYTTDVNGAHRKRRGGQCRRALELVKL